MNTPSSSSERTISEYTPSSSSERTISEYTQSSSSPEPVHQQQRSLRMNASAKIITKSTPSSSSERTISEYTPSYSARKRVHQKQRSLRMNASKKIITNNNTPSSSSERTISEYTPSSSAPKRVHQKQRSLRMNASKKIITNNTPSSSSERTISEYTPSSSAPKFVHQKQRFLRMNPSKKIITKNTPSSSSERTISEYTSSSSSERTISEYTSSSSSERTISEYTSCSSSPKPVHQKQRSPLMIWSKKTITENTPSSSSKRTITNNTPSSSSKNTISEYAPSSSSPKPGHQKQGSLQLIVSERTIIEKPSFELGVVRRERGIMKRKRDDLVFCCSHCELRFPTFYALSGHVNTTHKLELMVERQMNTAPSPERPKPCRDSQATLPDFKYTGTSLDPSTLNGPGGNSSNNAYPSFNGGIWDMNMAVEHDVTPYRSLTWNTSYGSSSKDPLPSYNYNMNNNHIGLSFDPFKSTGGGSTNSTYPWSNGSASGNGCPYLMDNIIHNSASGDGLDLELSLGPSKSIGDINGVLNDGVTRGTTCLNMPLRPHVSRYHFVIGSPLDSITRNVPPPPTTNLSNDLSSLEENVSRSSYSKSLTSKGKNIIIADDDHNDKDKDIVVIEDDGPKSWGRDLSLSL